MATIVETPARALLLHIDLRRAAADTLATAQRSHSSSTVATSSATLAARLRLLLTARQLSSMSDATLLALHRSQRAALQER
jgi:hypothetical protein